MNVIRLLFDNYVSQACAYWNHYKLGHLKWSKARWSTVVRALYSVHR